MQTAPAAPGLGSCVAGVRINVELGCVFLYAAELKFQFTSFLQVDGDLKLTAEKTQKNRKHCKKQAEAPATFRWSGNVAPERRVH